MDEVKETGGAYVGIAHATYPFAKLTVDKNKLELNVHIIGRMVFMPGDIESLELDTKRFSLNGAGIRIVHNIKSYRSKIIFLPQNNPDSIIRAIRATGFLDNVSPVPYIIKEEVLALQSGGSFPVKTKAAIIIAVIWNVLGFYNLAPIFTGSEGGVKNANVLLPLGFVFTLCLLLLFSPFVRQFILKDGHNIKDLRYFLYFLIAICMLITIPHLLISN